MQLNDRQIEHLSQDYLMIEPFSSSKNIEDGVSWGLSSYGYDIRLGDTFIIDINTPSEKKITISEGEKFELKSGAFILAQSLEHFTIPGNIIGMIKDKSIWTRKGISIINGVLEPKWVGQLTLAIVNHGISSIYLTKGIGIAQIIFFQGEPCLTPYRGDT